MGRGGVLPRPKFSRGTAVPGGGAGGAGAAAAAAAFAAAASAAAAALRSSAQACLQWPPFRKKSRSGGACTSACSTDEM